MCLSQRVPCLQGIARPDPEQSGWFSALPWEWGWIGEVCGARPEWAAHPATGGASGGGEGAEGRCQGHSLPTMSRGFSSPDACSALTPLVPLSMAAFSSSCQGHSLTIWNQIMGKKWPFVLKFTEIIRKRLHIITFSPQKFTPQMCKLKSECIKRTIQLFVCPVAGWSFPGDFHQSSGDR